MSLRLSFVVRHSLIHQLDPRTKLVLWFVVATPAIVFNSIIVSLAAFSITVILALLGRVGSTYVRNLTEIVVPVFIPIFLIQGLFNPAGKTPVLLILPWLSFKREGLVFAGVLLARLLSVFGGGYLLTLTTRPGDLMTSMQKLGLPLKLVYPLFSAFQIVPMIGARLESVKEAQMSRGLELEKINMFQKLKTYVPLITPLLMGAIEEAYRRSIALEARGFSSKVQKTFLNDVSIRRLDLAVVGSTVLAVVLLTSMIVTSVPQPNPWSL